MSINAFASTGNTVCLSVTTSAHTPVQVAGGNNGSSCYMIYNAGPNTAFLVGAASATNAVIPTDGTPANGMPIPSGSVLYWTDAPAAYWSAICAATQSATVYITPGDGK